VWVPLYLKGSQADQIEQVDADQHDGQGHHLGTICRLLSQVPSLYVLMNQLGDDAHIADEKDAEWDQRAHKGVQPRADVEHEITQAVVPVGDSANIKKGIRVGDWDFDDFVTPQVMEVVSRYTKDDHS